MFLDLFLQYNTAWMNLIFFILFFFSHRRQVNAYIPIAIFTERNSVKIKVEGTAAAAAAAGNEKVDRRELSIPVTGFIPFGSRDTRNGWTG